VDVGSKPNHFHEWQTTNIFPIMPEYFGGNGMAKQ